MEPRKSGIDEVGDVPWGTHICYINTSRDGKKDFLTIAASFLAEGLQHGEACVWIYSEKITSDFEVRKVLKRHLPNVDDFIACGQLKLISHLNWYLEDNIFNTSRLNKQWLDLLKSAIKSGYEGLRAVGDVTWLENNLFNIFADYEQQIDSIICDLPFLALCLYDNSNFDLFELADVINSHSLTIINEHGKLKLLRNIELLIKCKQLEKSRADYQNLLKLLPDGILIHDSTKIYYCNEAATRIIGVKEIRELADLYPRDLFDNENLNKYDEFIHQILQENISPCYLECQISDKNGVIKDIEVVASRYLYNGVPTVLSVVRDVSHLNKINKLEEDMRKNNELLQATLEYDKMKTEFFSNISHELRTPINVILSALQLMDKFKKSMPQDDRESKCLKVMRQNCYRLLRLVNNLIDITKIDSNDFELELRNCNIVEVVENITQSVANYIKSKGIRLQFDTNTEERIIACDPDQIERIILNLLSNAVKFTSPGGNIWVNVYDLAEKVVITVKDDGIGIPKDKQKYIFYRFQQVENLFNRHHEGSGIGLALVKSLVEKHGGTISVKSEVGQGSEFIIELPVETLSQSECDLKIVSSVTGHNFAERAYIELSDIYA